MFPSDLRHVSPGPPPLLTVPESRHDDDVVVQTHPWQQDDKADQLEDLEVLPSQEERDQPDEQGPHTIKHHACRRTQFFGYTNPSKVEESYTNNVSWKRTEKKIQGRELKYMYIAF